jgi:hypothetical protein
VEAYDVWKFLHIASMFAAVSIFVGQGMLTGVVAQSGDVRALRRVLAAGDRFAPIGGGLFLLGIVFGFVTAIVGELDLTQAWLVIAYVLVLFIIGTAFAYHASYDAKLKAAANASPDDRPSEQLRALVESPRGKVINVVDGLVWLAIIFVMVTKPFS